MERVAINVLYEHLSMVRTWSKDRHVEMTLEAIIQAIDLLDQRTAHCGACALMQGVDHAES